MTVQLELCLDAVEVLPAVDRPPDDDARTRIRTDVGATLFVEAGAGAGKTTALVGRILTLVDDGVPIESIAAITFTEKAAAELRHRVRATLDDADDGGLRRDALDALDRAPIGTLHAFARRILFEFPIEAGLPPGFTVLDPLESQLALDERWDDLLAELLDDADREVAPELTATDLVALLEWGLFGITTGLRRVIEDFHANWDLVEARVDEVPPPRLRLDVGPIVAAARTVCATATPPGDRQASLLDEVGDIVDGLASAVELGPTLTALDAMAGALRGCARCGNKTNWRQLGAAALDALRDDEQGLLDEVGRLLAGVRRYRELVVGAIAARFVTSGARARATAGTLEFHDLLVLSRRLLTRHAGARRALHERYTRLLLDEFQDTDPIQLDIAARLTAPPDGQPDDPAALRPIPGRLFVVGDPKQSIYRFRRADIAMYLGAADRLDARREVLSANFRSTSAVIEWINGVFAEVIQPEDGVQPAFGRLDAARPAPRDHGTVSLLGSEPHGDDDVTADVLRRREAADVAAAAATAYRKDWLVTGADGRLRPCQLGDIAVLLPARTSLPMLETAFGELDVAFRAENAAVVYVAPEIRSLMLALRAASDPTDSLALVAALRSELYGCSDVELFDWKTAGGRWSMFADPPAGFDDHPVAAALAHVASLARRVGRLGPAELLDALIDERRVLETALAAGTGARDVWRRLRYVVDQARSWTDAGGRGLRRYLRWTAHQAAEGRAGDSVLPEHDHDAVRIMTIHAAKGLEFPITIVAGLTTQVRRVRSTSVVWLPDGAAAGPGRAGWALAERGSEVFEQYQPIDEQMGDAERRRLLYVACTRAVDHLVVSLHRKSDEAADATSRATSATVLAACGARDHGATARADGTQPLVRQPGAPHELPWSDVDEWSEERRRTMRAASRRTATSATRLAEAMAPGPEPVDAQLAEHDDAPPVHHDGAPVDPGLAKDAVDLDLAPWQRGRYGTAIGRAVHGVLQDADLLHGVDIEPLAASQCAAEGIFGFEPHVAALARSALAAPVVRAAAAGAEHWRELFVVAEVGDVVLEGYVDLLVRGPDGLVIVDYKTDRWPSDGDQRARLERYRFQLCAYGAALARLLDEPVVGAVLVRCRTDGDAEQIDVPDWAAGVAEVGQWAVG